MNPIDRIEAEQVRKDVPAFRPGDTVRVHVRVVVDEVGQSELLAVAPLLAALPAGVLQDASK